MRRSSSLPKFSLMAAMPMIAMLVAAPPSRATDPEPIADAKAGAGAAEETPVPRAGCLQSSGSRIRVPAGQCVPGVSGRVYREDDLRATGAQTAGDALRQLDPTVTLGPGR